MHIEVYKGEGDWRWRFKNKGRVTACGEGHLTRAHAMRAAKAVVVGVLKCYTVLNSPIKPTWKVTKLSYDFVQIHWR